MAPQRSTQSKAEFLNKLPAATCRIWPGVRVHFSRSALCNCLSHSAWSRAANRLPGRPQRLMFNDQVVTLPGSPIDVVQWGLGHVFLNKLSNLSLWRQNEWRGVEMEGAGPVGQEVKDWCLWRLILFILYFLIIGVFFKLQSCNVYVNCGFIIIIISQNK